MKSYPIILAIIFLFLIVSTSIALAIIVIPPHEPKNDPPGPSISYEQVQKISRAQKECDRIKDDIYDRCRNMGLPYETCRRESIEAYQRCLEGMKYIIDPPQLILPK